MFAGTVTTGRSPREMNDLAVDANDRRPGLSGSRPTTSSCAACAVRRARLPAGSNDAADDTAPDAVP